MSDLRRKFPLTLHRTGQWCKKIRGRTYYFGKDKAEALKLYYKRATELHGRPVEGSTAPSGVMTLKALCNLYLDHQFSRVQSGEIQEQQYQDQTGRLKNFAKAVGVNRPVSEIRTIDLMNYRNQRINAGRAGTTINNELAAVKAMFHWALAAEVIKQGPNLDAVKKIPRRKVKRQTFTPEEIRRLMAHATPQWRAMILLGLNCGFGCTDVAELKWANVNLDTGRVCFPRPKTDVERDFPLWPETVAALKGLPIRGEHVFYTRQGNTWGYRNKGKYDVKPLTVAFKKLLQRAGIETEKGTGFYTLRRTAATIAAETGDVFAVQGVLGHADISMATTYVQSHKLTPQVDRAVKHTHRWLTGKVTDQDDSE